MPFSTTYKASLTSPKFILRYVVQSFLSFSGLKLVFKLICLKAPKKWTKISSKEYKYTDYIYYAHLMYPVKSL